MKRWSRSCLPLLAALVVSGAASAQPAQAPDPAASQPLDLRLQPALRPRGNGEAPKELPIVLRADAIRGRPDTETVAEGDVELRRGPLVIRADTLRYEHPSEVASARGRVRINRAGNIFSGPEAQVNVHSFEGWFLEPSYYFARTGAGGSAERIDFLGRDQALLLGATYTSCLADGSGGPAWLLSTDRVRLDFERDEGWAEGAVLRFYGVPILAAPVLSFPLSDARKSGWLPPDLNIDSRSGVELRVPYYWNIAPDRDATFTPSILTRRGAALDSEFRYLDARYAGSVNASVLPEDRVANRSRYAFNVAHEGIASRDIGYLARVARVSDDDYWKDFPGRVPSAIPRLLPTDLQASRPFALASGDLTTYARLQKWQVLQDADPQARIESPYERSPQLGLRVAKGAAGGFELALENEFNHFTLPSGDDDASRVTGSRLHALGAVARPIRTPGWSFVPQFMFNAATYRLDRPSASGRRDASRFIPTFSADSAWVFERASSWFGRQVTQTLEPRLLYVNTPFREQSALPNFDAAGRDFNFESIYTENAFSGLDRVSDAHQLTAGATTRLLDPASGSEVMRLGIVQRFLFREQRVTPEGTPFTQRFSDLLLLGSTSVVPAWNFDAAVQWNTDTDRPTRSILGARYSPGPFRTVSLRYRFARGLSEQVELGWQWPVYGRSAGNASRTFAGNCTGTWYGVGRINYSTRESRITDSVFGAEYDSGCWIGRIVFERLSTGRTEATTRLLLQLELVGLSKLGSNPLQVLKDNIPGYRLLREERAAPIEVPSYE